MSATQPHCLIDDLQLKFGFGSSAASGPGHINSGADTSLTQSDTHHPECRSAGILAQNRTQR